MTLNEKYVWRLIDTALKDNENHSAGFIDSLNAAWKELRDLRQQPGGSVGIELAAAEHYLFARWCVASGNVSKRQMIDLARLYNMKEMWDAFWGTLNDEAMTDDSVAETDLGVVIFGVLGAIQGAVDHDDHQVSRKPPFWRPVNEIFSSNGI
jgi:hypothetical protein